MTAEVIEIKRSPSIWSVKANKRFKADFSGAGAREKAEAFARENFGEFTVRTKPIPSREQRWRDARAGK